MHSSSQPGFPEQVPKELVAKLASFDWFSNGNQCRECILRAPKSQIIGAYFCLDVTLLKLENLECWGRRMPSISILCTYDFLYLIIWNVHISNVPTTGHIGIRCPAWHWDLPWRHPACSPGIPDTLSKMRLSHQNSSSPQDISRCSMCMHGLTIHSVHIFWAPTMYWAPSWPQDSEMNDNWSMSPRASESARGDPQTGCFHAVVSVTAVEVIFTG